MQTTGTPAIHGGEDVRGFKRPTGGHMDEGPNFYTPAELARLFAVCLILWGLVALVVRLIVG